MFKFIFGIIVGYISCIMNAGDVMKNTFIDSGAKEIVIVKIEEMK